MGKIYSNYISKPRFIVDILALVGSKPFQPIHRFVSLFGLFKVIRVFRIGQMISQSNMNDELKALLNIIKLFLYLLLYIHILACGMWVSVESGQGKRFYREFSTNQYLSYDKIVLRYDDGTDVPVDDNIYMKFGKQPTFSRDGWNRPIEGDMVGYQDYINRWDSRAKIWYMPTDFVNYPDQELGRDSEKYRVLFRYLSLLYYGILNIGSNEFGPVNSMEYLFCTITLILSAMLNAILFGDVSGLI